MVANPDPAQCASRACCCGALQSTWVLLMSLQMSSARLAHFLQASASAQAPSPALRDLPAGLSQTNLERMSLRDLLARPLHSLRARVYHLSMALLISALLHDAARSRGKSFGLLLGPCGSLAPTLAHQLSHSISSAVSPQVDPDWVVWLHAAIV